MKVLKINEEEFKLDYMSVLQILVKLSDTMHLFVEAGRGSGKTSHIISPRLDRVQNSMPGSIIILGSATYKSIFDNILPGMIEFFASNYEKGIYYEIGKKPPGHFKCPEWIVDWKHTISFHTGTVVQFASCDRPESFLGKNSAHLLIDELLKIKEEKFVNQVVPALRADRSKFGLSPYFMGITGTSSTPDFETDEDWWMKYESNMNSEVINLIIALAKELDKRIYQLEKAKQKSLTDDVKKLERFIERWTGRINEARKGQTSYFRASSLSNIKILGVDYIENQIRSIIDEGDLNTSIFAVRKRKVGERFWGKFGKQHIFDDSYNYNIIDTYSADMTPENSCRNLKYYNPNQPLYAGFDPGPFMSIVFAQYSFNAKKKEFRCIKNFWVIHPEQHEELAEKIDEFFKYRKNRNIYLHYDRAANQKNPRYRKYYPLSGDEKDSDAMIFKSCLEKKGFLVHLLSLGQETITHALHYNLGNILFSAKKKDSLPDIFVCRNECDELISSINHSPLKREEGAITLDKSSENLPYKEQILYSTQIASAWSYMIFGEFKKFLPKYSESGSTMFSGTFTG